METQSFSNIYQQYYKRSFLFVKSYVREDMAAEDIVSETLIKLWKTIQKENVEFPAALLVTMLKNNSLNYLKHLEIKQNVIDSLYSKLKRDQYYRISTLEACEPETLLSSEITEIINKTLATLPELTRKVFIMSRYENKQIKEIAAELNITPKVVEYQITKSLKAMRITLKDYLPLISFLFPFC